MNIEEVREYCLQKPGVSEAFPFDNETLVFKVGHKIFLLMSLERQPLMFNVKTNPDWSEELREKYEQIFGAYHMNKKHWNSVIPQGLPHHLVHQLIDHSYDLVFQSLTKKLRDEISIKL